jgi:hypothetical protein
VGPPRLPSDIPVASIAILPSADVDERVRRLEAAIAQLAAQAQSNKLSEPTSGKGDSAGLSVLSLGKLGWVAETIAEVRAFYRMFVDPRYSMTLLGKVGIPVLLALFFFPSWWMPLSGVLAEPARGLVLCVGQLAVGYGLFKLAFQEARRYREMAPDLPPSLRL